jgi:cell wall-associated NlpC family hydrolase
MPVIPTASKSAPSRSSRGPALVAACCLLLLLATLGSAAADDPHTPPQKGPTVAGDRAVLNGRIASAPKNAPQSVKLAIWATNTLTTRPYIWGGGHGTFYDRGYDCSGTISFFLHHAGLLDQPTPSKALQTWGECGPGKWVTLYARNGHVFAEVCGLRLDTSGLHDEEGPRWRGTARSLAGFTARHPAGL